MKPTFEHTTDVLAQAYNDGSLLHGVCYACAVGNLIADVNNYKKDRSYECFVDKNGDNVSAVEWSLARGIVGDYTHWDVRESQTKGIAMLKSTGYSLDELARIEVAFEWGWQEGTKKTVERSTQARCNAIHSVIDELADIHGITDPSEVEEAKAKFGIKPLFEDHAKY